jgi:hypothetical protein
LPDKAGPHHDGLEALSLDGPELAVGDGGDGCGALAVVENGELAENFRAGQRRQVFAFARHLDTTLCGKQRRKRRRDLRSVLVIE